MEHLKRSHDEAGPGVIGCGPRNMCSVKRYGYWS